MAKVSEMYKIHEQTFQEIRGGNIDCVFYSSSCVHDKYLSMSNVYSLRRRIDNSLTIFKIYTSYKTAILRVFPSVESR